MLKHEMGDDMHRQLQMSVNDTGEAMSDEKRVDMITNADEPNACSNTELDSAASTGLSNSPDTLELKLPSDEGTPLPSTETTDNDVTATAVLATAVLNTSEIAEEHGTTERMPSSRMADETAADSTPSFADVARTTARYVRGRHQGLKAKVARHPWLIAVSASLVIVVILTAVLAGMHAANLPDLEAIQTDAHERLSAPAYTPGPFGDDSPLTLHGATITDRHRTSDDTAIAAVHVTWVNNGVIATSELDFEYRYDTDTWRFANSTIKSVSFIARRGVDAGTITAESEALDIILARAETTWHTRAGASEDTEAAGTSLTRLYQDAEVSITGTRFDEHAQTDDLTLHLIANDLFTALATDVTAKLVFRPVTGTWELVDASASKDAKDLTYTPLVGNWKGTHLSTDAVGASCFGAAEATTSITIDDATADRITGSLTTLAHYHDELTEAANSSAGDTAVSNSFVATRIENASGIAYEGKASEAAGGNVTLRLDFGLADDPTAARATITSTHSSEATFLLIPYTRTTSFTDSYSLTKE